MPLHQVVAAHLAEFLEQAEAAGGLPAFVERTLRGYLDCGILSKGFVRVWCDSCRDDMLVAFSCKGRGVCPSCGGRRMADGAAHLVDEVFPEVQVRQWVLTFPYWLRAKLAYDAQLRSDVLALFVGTVQAFYRQAGNACGAPDGRSGSVTAIQRFGSALNLNLHFHTLFVDGVFYRSRPGRPLKFRELPSLTDADVTRVLACFQRRLSRLLRRRGLLDADPSPEDHDASPPDAMEQLALASMANRQVDAVAEDEDPTPQPPIAGTRPPPPPLCVRTQGFSLHAATVAPRNRRGALEALCRYILRPAITLDRVRWREDGQVELTLPRPWRRGPASQPSYVTRLVMAPLTFLGRLVPLIPAPRTNDIRYHGVFAPNAPWRREVTSLAPGRREIPCAGGPAPGHDPASAPASAQGSDAASDPASAPASEPATPEASSAPSSASKSDAAPPPDSAPNLCARRAPRKQRRSWAELMRRTFGIDVLTCAHCGTRRTVLAMVTCPQGAKAILEHLGLPSSPPTPPPQRAPPQDWLDLP